MQDPLNFHDNYFGSQTFRISFSGNTKQNDRENNYFKKMSSLKKIYNQPFGFDYICKSMSEQLCICFLTLRMANNKCLEKSAKVGQEYRVFFLVNFFMDFLHIFLLLFF